MKPTLARWMLSLLILAVLAACSSPLVPSPDLEQTVNQALRYQGFDNLNIKEVRVEGDRVKLEFRLGEGVTAPRFAQAFDTALRSVAEQLPDRPHLRFSYSLEGQLTEPPRAQAVICPGAPMYTAYNGRAKPNSLAQARVLLNPGHGWYLHNRLGWILQRPIPPSGGAYVQEDANNLDQAIAARDALQTTGATVWSVRELNKAAGNGVSGYPRWQEAAKHHLESSGAPEGVWNSERDATDGDCAIEKDIRSRALQANYLGADALVSLHTNAGGGRGTITFYSFEPFFADTPSPWAGQSEALARAIHTTVVTAIRQARPDLNWPDGQIIGVPSVGPNYPNYGELRFSKSPAALMEVGFHTSSIDGPALDDADFQQAVAVGLRSGLSNFFGGSPPPSGSVFPQAPELLTPAAGAELGSNVSFTWTPIQGATRYGLYISRYPYGAANLVYQNEQITGTALSLETASFRFADETRYRWNMTAFNGPGDNDNGSFAPARIFTLATPVAPPPPPTLASVTMSSQGQVFVAWPEVGRAQSYTFRATLNSSALNATGTVSSQSSPANGAVVAFLENPDSPDKQNQPLCLSIRASNTGGTSNWSEFSCATYRYYTGIAAQSVAELGRIWLEPATSP